MVESLNTFVDFVSDFPRPMSLENVSDKELARVLERRPVPGKELAKVLARGLECREIEVLGIDAYDFEHCIRCVCEGHAFFISVGVDDEVKFTRWTVKPYHQIGFFDRIRRRTYGDEFKRLLLAIDDTLRATPGVRDIRWFPDFDAPWNLNLRAASDSPITKPNSDRALSVVARLDQLSERISSRGASPVVIITMLVCTVVLELIHRRLGIILMASWFLTMVLCGIVIPIFVRQHAFSLWERSRKRESDRK